MNRLLSPETDCDSCFRRMKLKKEIQAIKELNEQEKQAQAAKIAQVGVGGCEVGPPDSV